MKSDVFFLFLFVIILLGLVICYFLNQPKYREGMDNNTINFTSETGASASLTINSSGVGIITFTNTDGTQTTYTYNSQSDSMNNIKTTTYTGENGGKAILIEGSNGMYMLEIIDPNGKLIVSFVSSSSSSSSNNQDSMNISQTTSSSSQPSSYDNYNHYSGTSYPTTFYGSNGGTARVVENGNGSTVVITNKNGSTDIYYIKNPVSSSSLTSTDPTMNTYYGPNGTSAKVVMDSNGKKQVVITAPNGKTIVYSEDNIMESQDTTTGTETSQATPYTSSTPTSSSLSASTYPPATNTDNTDYSSYLPPGIPKRMIPPGQEDLYILKSEVVPPVCPVCPEPIVQCPKNIDPDKIPPCPPCARCPEPAFDCKKVPNYNAFNPDYMPVPVLANFSSFGM